MKSKPSQHRRAECPPAASRLRYTIAVSGWEKERSQPTLKRQRSRSPGKPEFPTPIEAATATFKSEGIHRACLEITLVGTAMMRRLHAQWLNDDTNTDVLTFDLRDRIHRKQVDGQIIVCRPVAVQRARRRDIDWQIEALLYVVHGCLHLCGYDDHHPAEAERMHRREDEILTQLGLGSVYSSETAKHRRSSSLRRT